MKKAPIAAAAVLAAALIGTTAATSAADTGGDRSTARHTSHRPKVQDSFEQNGPPMHALKHAGRTVHYSDTGEHGAGTTPVLFLGGTGTSARASGMTDFFRTTRQNLGVRLISVERNGFGDTEYDPGLGFSDYTGDVLAVLDKLGLKKVKVVAISGGGPYAAHLASAAPQRIAALHLASAAPPYGSASSDCALPDSELKKKISKQITDPRVWWAFGDDSPVHRIPGFTDRAEEDGARTYYLRGQQADPSAQLHEQRLYCKRPGPDLSGLKAPVYLYAGEKDTTVPPTTLKTWREHLPKKARVKVRRFADTGHDEQYRHWDQILVDLAGYGDRTVVCTGKHTRVLPAAQADRLLKAGHKRATLGSCAWQK